MERGDARPLVVVKVTIDGEGFTDNPGWSAIRKSSGEKSLAESSLTKNVSAVSEAIRRADAQG
jgi:hypothetical protein